MATDCDRPTTELPEWVIGVDEKFKKTESSQPKKKTQKNGKTCIYRVPRTFTDDRFYDLDFSSFGPHNTQYDDFKRCKLQYDEVLLHFLRRSGKPLEPYYKAVAAVVEELKEAYDQLDPEWQADTDAFLQLMVVQGCILIEILRGSTDPDSYYASDSPLLGLHTDPNMMDITKIDILVLENQLPLLLLEVLLDVETRCNRDTCEILEDCIGRMFSLQHVTIRYDQNNKCKHILEVYRKSLVDQVPFRGRKAYNPRRSTTGFHDFNIPSATQLDKVGIKFTTSDTTSLMDISFRP